MTSVLKRQVHGHYKMMAGGPFIAKLTFCMDHGPHFMFGVDPDHTLKMGSNSNETV